jgi:Na+-transporting methylmalonyl-CoA/oxaloacetate decarboxylase gamma subunit
MKKIFLSIALLGVTMLSRAEPSTEKKEVSKPIVSECCKASVTDESTGDTATVTECATTAAEACRAAYERAKKVVAEY